MSNTTNAAVPVLFSWSGGKDSALALHALQQQPDQWKVVALLTTVADNRISHHGVGENLLIQQANAIGLPLDILRLPSPCPNITYEEQLGKKLDEYRARGVKHVAHGDIFLEDLRAYREQILAQSGMTGVFPLWQRDSHELVSSFHTLGFRAVLCCLDATQLNQSFAGRELNPATIAEFPAAVDVCGENGEYHSFVFDGPLFHQPVQFELGKTRLHNSRYYVDLHEISG